MDAYGTHREIQKAVLAYVEKPKEAVEFGCGHFSTQMIAQASDHVTVYEMQSKEWFKTIKDSLLEQNVKNVTMVEAIGPFEAISLFLNGPKPDYAFVDGHGESRFACIQAAVDRGVQVIVTHDTEQPTYKWSRVRLPSNYAWLDVKDFTPWTAVISNDTSLIENIQSLFRETSLRIRKQG